MAMIGDAPNARANWMMFEPDAARRHNRDRLAGPQVGAVADGPVRREDGAAEDRRVVERQVRRAAATRRSTGTTAYSARPPIEYIQSVEPSGRRRRVSPSYSVPCEAIDGEERLAEIVLAAHAVVAGAARHDERADHPPPDGQPLGVRRDGPARAPRPSRRSRGRARTASGSATSAFMTCRSVWQTPQARP